MNQIQTKDLERLLNDPNLQLIDVRNIEAYNGWTQNGAFRGGHIKGARSLPCKWTKYVDWIEIVRHKNILPEHQIVVYGDKSEETQKVADRFLKSGYPHVGIYPFFISEWTANITLPMEKLPRYRSLVSANWVYDLIAENDIQEYENDNYVVVHAHYRNRNAYLSGHIPGAIDMDTLALEAPETWNRRPPEELEAAFRKHGITSETTVVLYGKYMDPDNADDFPGSAAGDIGAIRCAMIMLYAGVKDVRVLNGGFQSWKDAGFEISHIDEPKNVADGFGVTIPQNPEIIVDVPQAKKMIASDNAELVCVRSWPEYIGEVSGYNYIEQKGRIPGAVFGDCGSDAYHMENYRNLDHTIREFREVSDIWRDNRITPDKHLAFYCGTGWRGSEAFFNAWLMGWPRVSVFDGGWFEWSRDPGNPVEKGEPEFCKV